MFSDEQLEEYKVAMRMQGGAYMFVKRIGNYHKSLSLDVFFKIRVRRIEFTETKTSQGNESLNPDDADTKQ